MIRLTVYEPLCSATAGPSATTDITRKTNKVSADEGEQLGWRGRIFGVSRFARFAKFGGGRGARCAKVQDGCYGTTQACDSIP